MEQAFWGDNNILKVVIAIADVGVVAYIVYRVLLLIRGTRAQQILVGLALIVVAFFASRLLGLKTLSWILDNFLSSFLLIVIVVFQHDIRRGLSRVGRRPFYAGIGYGQGAYLVDELTRAAEAMAKDRIGAIILVEREADLSELAETGIRVDGRISTGLLTQVFTPPGPLHDGALIIQQGRITAAAVFLPMTQNPRLDPSIGSRHRAAVGATEEVDAVAIVVSEERGQISIAERGVLTRDLDPAMLRKVLQRYFGPRTLTKSKPRKSEPSRA
ncbi:MAG: TIGR00159 family protein [Deltaproteobacteria bacterium RIFOXYA12_FULL_58_15]|nr:MAG: TIGR00159 family protein [Deltaproteobacteria bacterium RIFOXYA12_FULL_58_15]OGR13779.1 MAG: TIGR00159 family protein [Deltaproteobacteria bacterium RIFOXYB12_FULL_58_9]